jgi:CubicO group peptidase (beta-lactamase class C family)
MLWDITKTLLYLLAALYFLSGAMKSAARVVRMDPASRVAQVGEGTTEAPTDVEDLRELLEPIRAKHKVPALGIAVIVDGKLVGLGATGVRKAGGETPVTTEDQWHIGSCTKAMTATLIAMLVEEGKLSLEMTVGEFYRGRLQDVDAAWDQVTLEHLLTHRGGAPADLSKGGLWRRLWEFKGTWREARMELARGVLKHPPLHEPGKFLYSNAGYAIAGAMAEEVMDAPWEQLMQQRLFAPLGMTGAGFGAPGSPGEIGESGAVMQPWGHDQRNRPQAPGPRADNPAAIGPAGTVHCTLRDWARFVTAHLEGHRGESPLLPRESFVRLHTAAAGGGDQYGGGWIVTTRPWAKGDVGEGLALTHAGSNTMWYAVAWLAPERRFAVLVTCNQGGDEAAKATDAAAGAAIGKYLR